MKNIIILPCLLFVFQFHGQNLKDTVKYKATYKLTYLKDSTDASSQKSEIMWLFIGEQTSLFLSKPRALKDSMDMNSSLGSIGSESWKHQVSRTKTDFNYKIFKNREENLAHHAIKILDDELFYSEPLVSTKWTIEKESKLISGYKSQKATIKFAGRAYTAWFTSEIPVPEGPYKFSGLPGLILEIKDNRNHYSFNFVGFEQFSASKLTLAVLPDSYQKTTRKKLFGIQKKYQEDPIEYINNYVGKGGEKISVTINGKSKQQYKRKRKEKLSGFKNALELN